MGILSYQMYFKKKNLGNILFKGDEEDDKSNTACSLGMAHKFNALQDAYLIQ